MKPSLAPEAHQETIRQVVASHHTRNARIFGSVAHGTDIEGSGLDLLVDPTADTTLFDIGAMRHELPQSLGVPIDVLTPNALPEEFRAAVQPCWPMQFPYEPRPAASCRLSVPHRAGDRAHREASGGF